MVRNSPTMLKCKTNYYNIGVFTNANTMHCISYFLFRKYFLIALPQIFVFIINCLDYRSTPHFYITLFWVVLHIMYVIVYSPFLNWGSNAIISVSKSSRMIQFKFFLASDKVSIYKYRQIMILCWVNIK